MKKRFVGMVVFMILVILSLCGAASAMNIARPEKYNASEWQGWSSKYGDNCYLFVNNLLREEGRPLIEYKFTGGATIDGYDPITDGQVVIGYNGKTSISADDVKSIFANAGVGYVVQMYWYWSRYTPHTAVISALDDNGVEFLQANYYDGKITNDYYTWSDLARVFNNAGNGGGASVYYLEAADPEPPASPKYSVSQGLLNLSSSRYAKTYTLTSGHYKVYANPNLTVEDEDHYTGYDEEDYITGVGYNRSGEAYAQVQIPTNSGGRLTVYVKLNDVFVPGTLTESGTAVNKSGGLYKRKNEDYHSDWWIDPGDTVYLLTEDSGFCQVMYPISGASYWRIAWLTKSEYDYVMGKGITPSGDDSSARDKVVAYAWKIYNFTWYAFQPVLRHQGELLLGPMWIRGIPYTLYGTGDTFEQYRNLINTDNSELYDTVTYKIWTGETRTSMKHGMACATFVTTCIMRGFPQSAGLSMQSAIEFHTKPGWRNYVSEGNKDYNGYAKLQKGDYLDNFSTHVILVVNNHVGSGNNDSYIEYVDQTPTYDSDNDVGTHKGTYSYSDLSSKGYRPMYVKYPGDSDKYPPHITTSTLPDAYIGEPYYASIETTGTKPITYECNGTIASNYGFLLDGQSFILSSTNGVINGNIVNPTSRATPFTVNIEVTATNDYGSDTVTFPITVRAKGVPIDASHFPDRNFRDCLKEAFDSNNDGSLSDSEIANAKVFQYTEDMGFYSIDGIKYLTNLEWLYIPNNHIKNLDVSGLKKLGMLVCSNNEIESLNASGCTNLSELWAEDNNITSLSVKDCPNLKKIMMWNNKQLTELSMSDMPYLEELNVAGASSLEWLYIKNNSNMTGLYVNDCTSLARIEAQGSPKLSSFTLTNCGKLVVFERESNVVLPGDKPVISTQSIPDAYVGDSYYAKVAATGTQPIIYTMGVVAASNGFDLDGGIVGGCTSGIINGTPGFLSGKSIGKTPPYTVNVEITAQNYIGESTKTFKVTVREKPVKPSITTASLPDGKVGQAYSAQVTATGTTPITWSASGLPSGMSCASGTGKITGTPSSAGTYTVRVTANNGAGSSYKDFTITIAKGSGGGSDTGTEEDEIVVAQPKFKKANLTLSGQIAVNFFIDLPEISGVNYYDGKTCYTGFDINGNTTSNNPQPVDGEYMEDGYYGFKCYVTSIQMADPIIATFHYGNGKSVQQAYSVKQYLNNMLSKTTSAAVRDLMIAIKNYGHYAQVYLAQVNGWTLGRNHVALEAASEYTASDIEKVKNVVAPYRIVADSFAGSGIKSASYSLSLDSETTINLTFKMEAEYTGGFAAYLNGGSQNVAVRQSDGSYKVHISNIPAHKLADTQTVKIYAGKEITVKASGLTFVYTSMYGSNMPEDRQKAAVALYRYYEKTMAYRNAK